MRSDYKICSNCGAVLDIGEKCDCMEYIEKAPGSYKSPLDIAAPGQQIKYHHAATRSLKTSQKEEANILLQA